MSIPYPNRAQWVIIWTAALIAAHVWLNLRLSDFFSHPIYSYYHPNVSDGDSGWGLDGYLSGAYDNSVGRSKLPFVILSFGVLLVWQASGWGKTAR